MERKLNAFHKNKSRSQTDLQYKVTSDGKVISTGGKNKSVDDELFDMCALSGVKMDIDVFRIMIDLLRLNVNPNTLIDVLKKMANRRGMKSSKSSEDISRVRKKSSSDKGSTYAVYLESKDDLKPSANVDLI